MATISYPHQRPDTLDFPSPPDASDPDGSFAARERRREVAHLAEQIMVARGLLPGPAIAAAEIWLEARERYIATGARP